MRCRLQLCDQKWMFGGGMQNFFRQTIPNLPVIGSCWVALIFSTQKCQNDPKRVSVVHKIRSIQPSKGKSQKKHHGLTIQHWDFHGFPVIGSSVLNSSVRKTHPSSAQPRVSAVTTWPGRFSWPIYNMICVTTNKKSEDTFAFFWWYIWHMWAADHIFGTSHM